MIGSLCAFSSEMTSCLTCPVSRFERMGLIHLLQYGVTISPSWVATLQKMGMLISKEPSLSLMDWPNRKTLFSAEGNKLRNAEMLTRRDVSSKTRGGVGVAAVVAGMIHRRVAEMADKTVVL